MKSLLQRIADLLEADGIPVLGIDTYPPEKGEKEISVLLRVSHEVSNGLTIEEDVAAQFLRDYTVFDTDAAENADDVFRAYKNEIGQYDETLVMNRPKFQRFIKKNFPKYELRQMKDGDNQTFLGFINMRLKRDRTEQTPVVEGACHSCADPDCDICPISQANSDPVKLYTPEEAVRAMMAGKILKDKAGRRAVYKPGGGFLLKSDQYSWFITDFTGLYSEESHPQSDPVKDDLCVSPVKYYTPEEAQEVMKAGYILHTKEGNNASYILDVGFVFYDCKANKTLPLTDFTGMYRPKIDPSSAVRQADSEASHA